MVQHIISHVPTTDAESWKAALSTATTPSDGFALTKTLMFEAEALKTETAVLIMVVAMDNTSTSAGQIAKAAGVKEARLATVDAVQKALGVTLDEGTLTFIQVVI
jgi:prolyl-tRNA synthetase